MILRHNRSMKSLSMVVFALALLMGCSGEKNPALTKSDMASAVAGHEHETSVSLASHGTSTTAFSAVPQVLVLGIDGVPPEILNLLMSAGMLPNLAKLVQTGAYGRLRSIEPFFSPEIWTTIATGRLAEDHGVSGFTYVDPKTRSLRPTNSLQRKVPALWNLATQAGLTMAVCGWLCSWPPEPVNGVMVSNCFFMPENTIDVTTLLDPSIGAIHPSSIVPELADKLISAESLPMRTLQKMHLQGLTQKPMNLGVLSKDMSFINCTKYLLETRQPDLVMLYIQGIDVLHHNNWPAFEYYLQEKWQIPTPFRFKPDTLEAYLGQDEPQAPLKPEDRESLLGQGEVVVRYYQYVDRCVGDLLAVPSDRSRFVCVISDHGFGRYSGEMNTRTGDHFYSRPTHWHQPYGIVVLNGPGVKEGFRIEKAGVQDIFPTLATVLHLPLARNLAGAPLRDAFDPYMAPNAETTIAEYPAMGERVTSTTLPSDAEARVLQQLRSLGYIR
jgi:predicted AlkP superfamily phosphohydrolase/phosphomutase